MDWTLLLKSGMGLLAILNPLGAVPLFLGLTTGQSRAARMRTARLATFAVVSILVAATWLGQPILDFFGVRIASFRVGGGILLLLMSISMLQARLSGAKQTEEEAAEAEGRDSVGVVPLGIPLLAGPGAISLAIVEAQSEGPGVRLALTGMILLIGALIWLILRLSEPIGTVLGKTGINIVTRLMGLLLAAVAIEMIVTGLGALLPGLAG